MVESSEDPEVVTSRMEREMRYANAAYLQREEVVASKVGELSVEAPSVVMQELQPEDPPPAATDADASYRHGRLAVVAVIVLVLFWAWVQERRNARKERGVQNGRYGQ